MSGIFASVSKLSFLGLLEFVNDLCAATYVATELAHFCEQVADVVKVKSVQGR